MLFRSMGDRFIADMSLFASYTTSNLTTVKIASYHHTISCTLSGTFIEKFRPLLSRRRLQVVWLELQPYHFDLYPEDIRCLGRAWKSLQVLHISFQSRNLALNDTPTLEYTLTELSHSCRHIRYIHLPAMATGLHHASPINLPTLPSSELKHLSSDRLRCKHKPFNVAAALYTALPGLAEAVPHYQWEASKWDTINIFLVAIRNAGSVAAVEQILARAMLVRSRERS